MILEYGIPRLAAESAETLLPEGERFRRVHGVHQVDLLLPRASGLFMGVSWPVPSPLLADLRSIRRRYPWLPLLVAGPEPRIGLDRTMRQDVLQAGADRVICLDSTDAVQADEVRQLWRRQPLRRLAAMVQQATHLPDAVRALMVRALLLEHPVHDVAELASLARLHRASLWKLWKRAERPVPTAGVFVDWVQLLHVSVHKNTDRTWRDAALAVDARPSSMARLGKRVLGQPLSSLEDQVRRRVFSQFLESMVAFSPREIRACATFAPPLLIGPSSRQLTRGARAEHLPFAAAHGVASPASASAWENAAFTVGRTSRLSPPAVTDRPA